MTALISKRLHRALTWGLALGSCVGVAHLFGLFNVLEIKTLDVCFLLPGEQQPRSPIVVVTINEDSFDDLSHVTSRPFPMGTSRGHAA